MTPRASKYRTDTELQFTDFIPTRPHNGRQLRHALTTFETCTEDSPLLERMLIYIMEGHGFTPRRGAPLKSSRSHRVSRAPGRANKAAIAARVAYYGGLCWICAAPYQAVDHVKPIAKGGSKWPANLRPICTSCNSSKGAKWPFEATR